jgi:signal transduction histidine kinase
MTDLALETELTAEQADYLDVVKTSALSLLTVVNDILDFSRIEAEKLTLEHIDFSLKDIVNDVLALLEPRASAKGLALSAEYNGFIPTRIMGDPGRLRQILLNLLGNAVKFTERGSASLVIGGTAIPGGLVQLRFAAIDTGIGIAKEKQPVIFEAFSQADNSNTRLYGGTGLGLAISSQLVALMGGKLTVESEGLGKGSTFRFAFACEVPDAPVASGRDHGADVGVEELLHLKA